MNQTRNEVGTALDELAEFADAARAIPASTAHIEQQIRSVIACIGFGGLTEIREVPSFLAAVASPGRPGDLREALSKMEALGTLAAAADLDPLDPAPAHLVLPSAIAVLVLAEFERRSANDVVDAVAIGIECAARLRRCVTSVRPGGGFHSAGTFGLFAAATACSRLLALDATATANAIAIGLTRAGGLAMNSAASRIGLTHFGHAAAHGAEAALLAADGWTASHDLGAAYRTLFGTDGDFSQLGAEAFLMASRSAAFKHYPCNIYLNLAVKALLRLGPTTGPIEVVIPPVGHLDNPEPRNVRELRNSAQGALAAVSLHGTGYVAFAAQILNFGRDPALLRRISTINVRIDSERPTALDTACVEVRTDAGIASAGIDELGPWDARDLARLRVGSEQETASWACSILEGNIIDAFGAVLRSIEGKSI